MVKVEHFNLVDRLHTDVLEEKYGPISVRLLRHDTRLRAAHLIDQTGTSRTFALTFFPREGHSGAVAEINSKIRAGAPIGKAFRQHGYSIRKNVLDVYNVSLPNWLRQEFKTTSPLAKARVSEFYAKSRTRRPVIYGTVVEIYSPDFRKPLITHDDIEQINPSTDALSKFGIPIHETWNRIGNNNDFSDCQRKRDFAFSVSHAQVARLKRKISRHLAAGF